MQDVKGNQITVGKTVKFDLWDESNAKKAPQRVPTKGTVVSMSGGSNENERLGTVQVQLKDKTVSEQDCQAVEVQTEA